MAHFTRQGVGADTELLVCVVELLREDKPLDDYLGEMDRATRNALRQVEDILDTAGDNLRAKVKVKILRGMELEVTDLVACQARDWQADLIQLSAGQGCAACRQGSRRGNFSRLFKVVFNFNRRKSVAQELAILSPYTPKPISLTELLRTTDCRINLTCHGERLFTLYMHHSAVNSGQDRP